MALEFAVSLRVHTDANRLLMTTIGAASLPEELAQIRILLREYADSLPTDLCFQGFEAELSGLPGKYAHPAGRLLLACNAGRAVGCVALRRIDDATAEMKRLYVRPEARGLQLGRRLVERICDEARFAGYSRICLDTLPTMLGAQHLYQSVGFVPVEPYVFNPVPGTRFLAVDL